MNLLATFLTQLSVAALASPGLETGDARILATAEVVERIPLPRTKVPVTLVVAPLDATVTLVAGKDAPALAGRIAAHAGELCPKLVVQVDRIELSCRSRRIDAVLTTDNGTVYLDLFQLRGLPWRPGPDGPPLVHYEPVAARIGVACPGSSPGERGECAFKDGRWIDAARAFRDALDGRDKILACVRLGDLALIAGDPASALGWYQRAGSVGPFARIAIARLCEMDFACLTARPLLDRDPSDLPAPLRDDILLRRARLQAFRGEFAKTVATLASSFAQSADRSLCRGAGELPCRRLLLAGLHHTQGGDSQIALEVYLELPRRDAGPLLVELVQAAAEASARLGAPVFGASLLASTATLVSPGALTDHLLRAAELYLVGRDPARARVIVDFVDSRTPKILSAPRWTSVRQGVLIEEIEAQRAEERAQVQDPLLLNPSAELAAARTMTARADQVLAGLGAAADAAQGPGADGQARP